MPAVNQFDVDVRSAEACDDRWPFIVVPWCGRTALSIDANLLAGTVAGLPRGLQSPRFVPSIEALQDAGERRRRERRAMLRRVSGS